jgi:8-oxo-dGTP diphosphatase
VTAGETPHLVAASLLRRGGRVLLLHRTSTRRWYPDCWDLPGSHVEDGEMPDSALHRELVGELGIDTVPTEHDALAWLHPKDLAALKLGDSRLAALFQAGFR